MKKTYVECDRCGASFGELDYVPPTVNYHGKDETIFLAFTHVTNNLFAGNSYPTVDLCPSCRKAFTRWFDQKPSLE